jgi:gluconate 2-dehydrogenase subunit 3-like protein
MLVSGYKRVIPSADEFDFCEKMKMGKSNPLQVMQDGTAASGRLTRREMVQRLLAGVSGGAAWPLASASHPIYKLLLNDAILVEAEKLGKADWKPVFLNAQQNETLIALAESIVPGSTKAQVNRFIDLLLSVDKADNQQKFAESLLAFDAEAQKRLGKNFPSLDEKQKVSLLTDASAKPASPDSSNSQTTGKQSTLHEHFENLKGWVSGAYYSSELGMRELGWTGDYVFETFAGCAHAGEHR